MSSFHKFCILQTKTKFPLKNNTCLNTMIETQEEKFSKRNSPTNNFKNEIQGKTKYWNKG